MEIKDYASNSHKSKEVPETRPSSNVETEGTKDLQMRKPTVGKKLMKTFIQEDFEDIKDAIIYDYIIPGIKDVIRSAIDMALGGDGRSSSRYRSSSNSRNSYDKYYRDRDRRDDRRRDRRDDDRVDLSDIVYDSKAQVEDIRAELLRELDRYEVLSVSNFWDILRENDFRVPERWRNYTDNAFGWYDLGSCRVERVRDGWIMRLPRTISLDNDR